MGSVAAERDKSRYPPRMRESFRNGAGGVLALRRRFAFRGSRYCSAGIPQSPSFSLSACVGVSPTSALKSFPKRLFGS